MKNGMEFSKIEEDEDSYGLEGHLGTERWINKGIILFFYPFGTALALNKNNTLWRKKRTKLRR